MRKLLVLLIGVAAGLASYAQVQSPAQFLGYDLGTHFSPHFKIVDYFKQVAAAAPSQVKLETYGSTNEGRPLLLAYISSPENIAQLENIRLSNLSLAGMSDEKVTLVDPMPAIVWLSYNVHGNEASSSEAAMLTLYELVNPSNPQTREWLKHVVVIMDPCLNPDGRDRYVNWYNSVVGATADPQSYTREHDEPWPGGRPNHYYFDLNRDWVWQTQVETCQRIAKYNEWLPHVHVDYHEQGYNNPYYFAPAAEPFHEVITDWQRRFQVMIGKNNARYFDKAGWLYFTREEFDLFYPSYGDTYPLYRGAIGMTFEQAGHSRAGLAVINQDKDTLTLWDRLYHHFTTGMSTIETAAQNAGELVSEFKKYYADAASGKDNEFKGYLVKDDGSDRLTRLLTLLRRNKIKWEYVKEGNYTGLNYFTGKSESFKTAAGDVLVRAGQPNGVLTKVLFERNPRLSDSVTYDITAWAVPFAYGLQTYGITSAIGASAPIDVVMPPQGALPDNAYAYAVPWNGLSAARFLAVLLKENINVRYAEMPFTANGHSFERGTLLVTRTGNSAYNKKLSDIVATAAEETGVLPVAITSGFVDKGFDLGSDKIHLIRKPRIALLAGDRTSSIGVGEVWQFFEQQLHYPIHLVWTDDFNREVLGEIDVLILPSGRYDFLRDKARNEALQEWVRGGGRLLAMEGAVAQLAGADWGIKAKEDNDRDEGPVSKEDYGLLRRYENRVRESVSDYNTGTIYKVDLDNTHPLAFGYPDYYYTLKQDDNLYAFMNNGWNVGVLKKQNYVSGFVGADARQRLKDGLLLGVQDMGRGCVVYMADDPLFRSFWENGKLLVCNAVFLVGQ